VKTTLGTIATGLQAGAALSIDVDRLIETRLLLTANSGGGKSWALRRVLEQTHGKVPQFVIDPEGEFFTLRERYDYVLAGRGGDCPAEVRSAPLLARKLLELGASAVLDLYELAPRERVRFVKAFLESLIDAPRELWRPALVVIDEAHAFAPEKGHGEAESVEAVARLMAQGRKRGFAGVLATQRLSKLAKDVAAEANNLLIGRAALDVDLNRAGEALGISKADRSVLRSRAPGAFYAFGPALSDQVVEVKVGEVQTSHPRAGEKTAAAPAPRAKVKAILGQLADLPQEAEAELKTSAELRARVRDLEGKLRAAEKGAPAPKVERIEVPVVGTGALTRLEAAIEKLDKVRDRMAQAQQVVVLEVEGLRKAVAAATAPVAPAPRRPKVPAPVPIAAPRTAVGPGDASVGTGGLRRILIALAQRPGLTNRQIGVRAGISSSSGTFSTYLSKGRTQGWIRDEGDRRFITDAGAEALGAFEPLPSGPALLEHWLRELGGGAARILRVLAEAYPEHLSNREIGERAQISHESGTFSTYMSKLRTLELVTRGVGTSRASEEFFQ
jgi:hypothetical protein